MDFLGGEFYPHTKTPSDTVFSTNGLTIIYERLKLSEVVHVEAFRTPFGVSFFGINLALTPVNMAKK